MVAAADIPLDALCSVSQAHVKTGIPKRRLYKWIETGKLRSIIVGGVIMLHMDDVALLERTRK